MFRPALAWGLGVAIAGGFAGTFLARAWARRVGFVNAPNPLVPQHTAPVAYLGGVGLALGIGAGLAVYGLAGGVVTARLWLPAALVLALGVIDDRTVLRPGPKFALQALVAAWAVATGTRAELTGVAFLDAGVSWLWLLTAINAFNLTDVCDGLLASLSIVVFSVLAIQDPARGGTALVIAGATAGFLFWNRPRASIFLGDAGSHLLGFLAGALTLESLSAPGTSPVRGLAGQALVMGVPLFELVFLTAVRARKGLPWWKGSPDHFSLRLQAAGLTRGQTDLVACAFAAAWAACGLAVSRLEWPAALGVAAAALLSAGTAAAYLLRHEVLLAPRPSGS